MLCAPSAAWSISRATGAATSPPTPAFSIEDIKHGPDRLKTAKERARSRGGGRIGRTSGPGGRWCLEIARPVGLDDGRCQVLSQAALLHDVGKLALPRALLRKPGRLSRDERALLVRHVTSGALLRALGVDEAVLSIIAGHHERWDGAGYPSGMVGEAIPLEARILTLADSYDAMISPACTRKDERPVKPLPNWNARRVANSTHPLWGCSSRCCAPRNGPEIDRSSLHWTTTLLGVSSRKLRCSRT